ncbi:MAG: hypothetical protein L3J09_09785 [Flavobacteriaceae bacterium]|nr:hypothetical protein [Flavobacteriaceae bacterium]
MDEINLKIVVDLLNSGSLNLIATQERICLPMLQRIYKKMKFGIEFDNLRVNDSRIVDGHHRYICSVLIELEIGMNDYPIASTSVNCNWEDIEIDDIDYETEDQIQDHNIRDSELNNVEIDILNDL